MANIISTYIWFSNVSVDHNILGQTDLLDWHYMMTYWKSVGNFQGNPWDLASSPILFKIIPFGAFTFSLRLSLVRTTWFGNQSNLERLHILSFIKNLILPNERKPDPERSFSTLFLMCEYFNCHHSEVHLSFWLHSEIYWTRKLSNQN